MKIKIALSLFVLSLNLPGTAPAQIAQVLPANYGITGIRQDSGGNVIVTGGTGSPSLSAPTPAFLYYGPLNAMPSTVGAPGLYTYVPNFGGGNITGGAQFYGPNTNLYDPSLGAGNFRVVGAYKATAGAAYQNGMMYVGGLNGNGTWTTITAPGDGISTVGDTIPHSNMGNIAVGDFDYVGMEAQGNGFIFDFVQNTYKTVSFGAFTTTIYGVWQDGGPGSTQYTMVGGYSDVVNGGKGYIVNYDAQSQQFANFTTEDFDNDPSFITHFEGISAVPGGFSLASTTLQGAGLAFVPQNLDGSFGTAVWTAVNNNFDPSAPTTGDTVIDSTILGIYTGTGGATSYLTVPEPAVTSVVFGVVLGGWVLVRGRMRRG
jgi:hypothetical protein